MNTTNETTVGEVTEAKNRPRVQNNRLFIGVYPCGLVYADRSVERNGDYKRLAFLPYATLKLEIEADCPFVLERDIVRDAGMMQKLAGTHFQISTCGQTVLLGSDPEHMRYLLPRHVSVECVEHPEWGTFGLSDDKGAWYDLMKGRVLFKSEAVTHWRVARG